MENSKQPARPFALEYEDAKKDIIGAVNYARTGRNVPWFLLETLLGDLYRQAQSAARTELECASEEYRAQNETADVKSGDEK